MGYEIDFLPVGSGEKSGDAIALRYGNLYGDRLHQFVVVVDGGTKESGSALVNHIHQYYGTDYVDLVISTHPDADHACGLEIVLEELRVGALWMHRPWRRNADLATALRSGSAFHGRYLSERVALSMRNAEELDAIAARRGIPVQEPFTGLSDHNQQLVVLGPTQAYYDSLIDGLDAQAQSAGAFRHLVERAVQAATDWLEESWDLETLTDDGETSPRNNTSVILGLFVDDHRILLTADAGAPALHQALNFLEYADIEPQAFRLVQVPHHGSKRNVGPTILDRLLGPRRTQGKTIRSAIVSAAADAPKHPARKVTNAFLRRGTSVCSTEGNSVCYGHNNPQRANWGPAKLIPFYPQVEE